MQGQRKDNAQMQERAIVAGPQLPAPSAPQIHMVLVQPLGQRFTVEAGQSLLRAAEAAGIELPSSCRNGTCRSCLCQSVSGQISHLIEWPGLSPEEKAEGWLLPCVAQAHSDLVLDVPLAFALFPD